MVDCYEPKIKAPPVELGLNKIDIVWLLLTHNPDYHYLKNLGRFFRLKVNFFGFDIFVINWNIHR